MIKTYIEIKDYNINFSIEKSGNLLLTDEEEIVVERLLKNLEDLNSVTVALQSDSTTLPDARAILDEIQGKFPSLESLIVPKAPIVEHPSFESAVIKVQ